MDKKQNIYKVIMLVFITIILTTLVSTVLMYNYVRGNGTDIKYIIASPSENMSELSKEIQNIRAIIDTYYMGELNEDDLINSAVKGYVDGLEDEYTEYMTNEEWEAFREDALGNFTGIGVYLLGEENGIRVIGIIEDSPAEKYGIELNDLITKIDDKVANVDTLEDVVNYIKTGKEGTEIQVHLTRGEENKQIAVKREVVRLVKIESELLEGKIGYLRFITFDEKISEDFKTQYEELKKQGATSFIVDIRHNGGGVLDEALQIADYMLPKDTTLLIANHKKDGEEIYKAKKEQTITEPIVLLINRDSASASEILAGALKDNKRATLVGETTYGKGTLQEVLRLNNGSALKITTSEFFTPLRNKINKTGVAPDVTISTPAEYVLQYEIPRDKDTQLQEAIKFLNE